ncbi:SH2 domain-containing adapter protein F-like protein [Dinothrombium tinctorium]|uniref:SH2 domain-containing adapter protein D n=1 Tax=Dinothrombium tinctorium TaxID=1965070 RepID=A0A3S3P8J5_9ACAR|nr:SH2 domain-containing adapter protein F-like protein [Dinothrombium tinctorium]
MSKIWRKLTVGKKQSPPVPPTPDYVLDAFEIGSKLGSKRPDFQRSHEAIEATGSSNRSFGELRNPVYKLSLHYSTKTVFVAAFEKQIASRIPVLNKSNLSQNIDIDSLFSEQPFLEAFEVNSAALLSLRSSIDQSRPTDLDSQVYDFPETESSNYDDVCHSSEECSSLEHLHKADKIFVATVISKIQCLKQDFERESPKSVEDGVQREAAIENLLAAKEQNFAEFRYRNRSCDSATECFRSEDSLTTDEERISTMAAKNKSRGNQQIYETAFDSKLKKVGAIRGTENEATDKMQKKAMIHNVLYPNTFSAPLQTQRRGSESSTSFTPEHSSRSSTASSSSNSSHGSATSTPQHLNQLPKALLPRKQGLEAKSMVMKSSTTETLSSIDSVFDSDSSTRCLLSEKFDQKCREANAVESQRKNKTKDQKDECKQSSVQNVAPSNSAKATKDSKPAHVSPSPVKQASKFSLKLDSCLKRKECMKDAPEKLQLQSPQNDSRPVNDYDTPWDVNKRLSSVVTRIISTPTSEKSHELPVSIAPTVATPTEDVNNLSTRLNTSVETQLRLNSYMNDQVSESLCETRRPNLEIKSEKADKADKENTKNHVDTSFEAGKSSLTLGKNRTIGRETQLNLSLNLYNVSNENCSKVASRKKLAFNFGFPIAAPLSEAIDVTIPLEKQGWFHGSIRRLDAENLLRSAKEGSFLIRNSESTKHDYSLSLKSAKGFMHMKIVQQNDGKYVLGVFSKPFNSIPDMVKHYSVNKLPIRGAEHMSLLYPVIDQLL